MRKDAALEQFFARETSVVARGLIGASLAIEGCRGIIVETEAYRHDDPASHSFGGRNGRNASMFGPGGIAYVYRSYGVHWCLNFVCGSGCAVLIRALEPTLGIDRMRARRGSEDVRQVCSGPGKLTEALGIDGSFDGLPLDAPPFKLTLPEKSRPTIVTGPRIGISKAAELPWRYGLSGSPFLSRRFPGA
jgi:DNA-3-methyladenine glycosylase